MDPDTQNLQFTSTSQNMTVCVWGNVAKNPRYRHLILNTLFKIIYLEGKFCSSIQYCWTEPQTPVVNKYVGLCPVLCFSISIVLSSLHN